MNNRNVSVDLSAPQGSIMGKVLFDLHYKSDLLDLLDSPGIIKTGFPHNGGSHTLRISGPAADIIDFLRILKSEFPDASSEIHKVHKALLVADRVRYTKIKGIQLNS